MSESSNAHEIRLAKLATKEWMDKWQKAEMRISAIWNMAIDAAMKKCGNHDVIHPSHPKSGFCESCAIKEQIKSLKNLDMAGYVPIKERARKALKDLQEGCGLEPAKRKAYIQGLNDMLRVVDRMLADNE